MAHDIEVVCVRRDKPAGPELAKIDITGLTKISSFSLRDTFTDPLGSCEIQLGLNKESLAKCRDAMERGNEITVRIDGIYVFWGLIQRVSLGSGPNGVEANLFAESVLAGPYRSSIDWKKVRRNVKGSAPIEEIIDKAFGASDDEDKDFDIGFPGSGKSVGIYGGKDLSKGSIRIGLTEKEIKSSEADIEKLKAKSLKSQPDETVYGFIQRILSRLGLILRPTSKLNRLVITEPVYEDRPSYAIGEPALVGGITPCFDDWQYVEDNTSGYSEVIVEPRAPDSRGKKVTSRQVKGLTAVEINSEFPQYKSGSQPHRRLRVKDKYANDGVSAKNSAFLRFARKAQNAVSLTCKCPGFSNNNGDLFWTNKTVAVKFPTIGLDGSFWVYERTFVQQATGGQHTELKLIPKGSLVIGELD